MRQLTVTTDHGDSKRAAAVAAAVRPDNTDRMETTVDGSTVRTTVGRESTGGLRATVDDYLVNLRAADRLTAEETDRATDGERSDTATDRDANTNANADTNTNT